MNDWKRLFAYNDWANRHTLESLRSLRSPIRRARSVMGHIVAAERLWWFRLHPDDTRVVVWPDSTVEECAPELEELARNWCGFLDALTPEGSTRSVSYVNSRGEAWTSTVEEILMHVILHSGHHRGQIATLLRQAGEEPATTDFIHATRREGL